MEKLKKYLFEYFGMIVISGLIFCSPKTNENYSSTTLDLDSILIDTAYGYPYPKNYDWEEWVKSGKYSGLPIKRHNSPKPLVDLMHQPEDELYRMIFSNYRIVIYNDNSNPAIYMQKDSVISRSGKSSWSYPDSVKKIERYQKISLKEFNELIKLINKVDLFSKTTTDSVSRLFYDYDDRVRFEGIKKRKYNFLYRICPDNEYEPDLYQLRMFILLLVDRRELQKYLRNYYFR